MNGSVNFRSRFDHGSLRSIILLAIGCWGPLVNAEISVRTFLPTNHVSDGTEIYRAEIQDAIDQAAGSGQTLRFPAITFGIDQQGWQLRSNLTIDMRGATIRLADACSSDGAVFRGTDVSGVTIIGGRIVGQNDIWPDGVNIRGFEFAGKSSEIRLRELHVRDLSSNAIGLFGTADAMIRDVWIEDIIVDNCCKRYADYLSGEKPEAGSVREDQGDVAFYFVENFVVRGCRFERSRSDGTHFYRSSHGQITDNRILRAKMGGYFLEQCDAVVGRGNVIVGNGSRGATIERGSTDCIFADNIVRRSGREGLWAPDCIGLVVTGNVFDQNGRKPNGPIPRYRWNANITINQAIKDPSNSPTRDYLISDNILRTTDQQIAAVRVDAVKDTQNIYLRGNILIGENARMMVEGVAADEVHVTDNAGLGQGNQTSSLPFPGTISRWNGFRRFDFEVDGKEVLVVAPRSAAEGMPWIWHGEFFGHKPEPDIELLKRGFHVAYMRVPDMLGSPSAVAHWNAFYEELTGRYGLADKVGLVGLSRGGLYCYNWAVENPDKVACIYGDAPVCDFKSWPGGRGQGKGSPRDWKLVLESYGFANDAEALAYGKNPVDNLAPLADAGVSLLHVYGDADQVVPWEENTGLLVERYRKIGGSIELIAKPGIGHHPHGLDDSSPIVDFFVRHAQTP